MNEPLDVSVTEDAGLDRDAGLSRWAQLGIGLLIVVLGLASTAGLIASRSAEKQSAAPKPATPVEVVLAAPSASIVQIESTGVVTAAQQISVVPQVSGALVMVSPELVPGGRFAKGEVIARIDARDYRLGVDQERSRVKKAEVELALEEARQETARKEWMLLGYDGEAPALAARQPQLDASRLALESAESGLARAQLSLERTALRAPFNAMVISENADVGQVVGGAAVATLVGTDEAWVQVSVPVEQLAALQIPGVNGEEGSRAVITQGTGIVREGHVFKLSGQLDVQSRTATLIISVPDPLNLSAEGSPGLPLLPGAFVDVTLTGLPLQDSFTVPRIAVKDDDHVWLVEGGKLSRRAVTVGWRSGESLVLTGGLEPGDRIVTTPISFPIEGMEVAVMGEEG